MLGIFDVAASALSAQSVRLNAIASNLANAESVVGPNNTPYRAKQVVFETLPLAGGQAQGVVAAKVVEDASAPRLVYDPKSPLADASGYVSMPNVNVVEEMVNMISASRSYQNNAEIIASTKALVQKALQIGT